MTNRQRTKTFIAEKALGLTSSKGARVSGKPIGYFLCTGRAGSLISRKPAPVAIDLATTTNWALSPQSDSSSS